MNILYKTEGPAKEYADDSIKRSDGWAANLTKGCVHGCKYCYVPDSMAWKFKGSNRRELFHADCVERKDVLHKLELDLKRCAKMIEPIFFSFTTDPYQVGEDNHITRSALLLCEKYGVDVNILTKGGMTAGRDLDIFERNTSWKLGVTLIFAHRHKQEQWEPYASSPLERCHLLHEASGLGIYTWVSVEPVISATEALLVLRNLEHDTAMPNLVNFRKVGKLNHGSKISPELGEIEASIDWGKFLADVEALIPKEKLLIKHDLEAFRKG